MNLNVSDTESAAELAPSSALSVLPKAEQLLPALWVSAVRQKSPACFPGWGQGACKDVCLSPRMHEP